MNRPYKPSFNDRYYVMSLNTKELYIQYVWINSEVDFSNYERGIVFQTRQEAVACGKATIAFLISGDENESN